MNGDRVTSINAQKVNASDKLLKMIMKIVSIATVCYWSNYGLKVYVLM